MVSLRKQAGKPGNSVTWCICTVREQNALQAILTYREVDFPSIRKNIVTVKMGRNARAVCDMACSGVSVWFR